MVTKNKLTSFVSWLKGTQRETWAALAGGFVALLVVVFAAVFLLQDTSLPVATSPDLSVVVYRHPLTGAVIEAPLAVLPQVFGVMVENSADAWPLAGIDEAFLVIEAPVEGAIPRFITFYSDQQDVAKIGPVRSARPYYLDWNDELDAVYGHVGGSPEALGLMDAYGTIDLDEFYQSEYFYRDNRTRYAPHNAYTTLADLRAAVDELQLDAPEYDVWTFRDYDLASDTGSALSLDIDWSSGTTYDVLWEYDLLSHDYLRRQGGEYGFTDLAENGPITADNVVVMESDITVVDGVGRRHVVTVGEGRAYVAQDGRVINATWRKPSRTERLRFYDEQGNEIAMNAGTTWIEVVPSLSQVSVLTAL